MKAKFFFIAFFIIIISSSVLLPQVSDSVLALTYYEKGREFRLGTFPTELSRKQRDDSAYSCYTLAYPLLKKAGLWKQLVTVSNHISKYKFKIDKAEGISFLENVADTLIKYKVYDCIEDIYIQLSAIDKSKTDYYLTKVIRIKSEVDSISINSRIYKLLGMYYRDRGNIDTAIYYYSAGLEIKRKAGLPLLEIYKQLSLCHRSNRNYDLAFKYLDSAIIKGGDNVLNITQSLNDKGAIYAILGNYEKAIEYCERAIKLQLLNNTISPIQISINYHNIANMLNAKGDYIRSNEYLQQAIKLLESMDPINKRNNDKGIQIIIYKLIILNHLELDEYQIALDYTNKLYSSMIGSKIDNAIIYDLFGKVYYHLGVYDSSLKYFNLSGIHTDEMYVANLHIKLGNFATSRLFYNKVINRVSKRTLNNGHPFLVQTHLQIGDSYFQEEKYDSARIHYELALKNSGIKTEDSRDTIIELVSSRDTEVSIFQVFWRLAQLDRLLFFKTDNRQALIKSHQEFMMASALLNVFKLYLESEKSKLFWSQNTSGFFDDAIDNALFCSKNFPEQTFLRDAFSLMEMSKGHILKGSINETSARKISDIPDSLLSIENSFKDKLNSMILSKRKELLKKNPDQLKLNSLENEIFNIKRDYSYLIKNFETQFPDYYKLKYETNTINISDLQRKLSADQSVLQYYLGTNKLHLLVIDKDSVYSNSCQIDTTFLDGLKRFIGLLRKGNLLKNKQRSELLERSHLLYKVLLDPVSKYIYSKKELVIIPGGALLSLPFEVLISESSAETSFSSQSFLIKDFVVSYQYSATLGFNPIYQKQSGLSDCFAGFAPSFEEPTKESGDRGLTGLVYNEDEVKQISSLFKLHNKESRIFTGADASKKNFKSLGPCKYTHIATHSLANEETPDLSALYFSNVPGDSSHDNILYADEVFSLKLNSDLIVLSACETGFGKIVNGEGILALTRGFVYIGIPNLLFSLWEVSDRNTSNLMVEFYKNVLEGKNYKNALRDSKLKMLSNEFTSFPDKWGAFVLIGN